jgi:hypothetical protein
MAWSNERFELEDVRLFKTAHFDCSRSGNLSRIFGIRLRLLFAIGSGLRCRGEKHDPVPDLLTRSAFLATDVHGAPACPCSTCHCRTVLMLTAEIDPKPGELETRIRRYDGEYRWFRHITIFQGGKAYGSDLGPYKTQLARMIRA